MARPIIRRLLVLSIFSLAMRRASARAGASDTAELFGLAPRADSQCQSGNFQQCNNFPGNFCCQKGSTCVSVNGGKSALCCPSGRDCSVIGTISCDLQQQNATSHPLSQLFTTDLTTPLQKCGDLCCPAGMACQGDSQCVMANAASSSSAAASSSKPTSSSSAAASSSEPTNSRSTPDASITPLTIPSSQNSGGSNRCNQFATPGVLVGFFSGLAAGVIATVLCICCIGRKRSNKRESGDLSSVQASVSDPIYHADGAASYRTDFLRKVPGSSKRATTSSRTSSRVKSFFSSRTPTMRSKSSPTSTAPKTPKTPKTPSMHREPSMESIKIYSPPNLGATHSVNTTFNDMLKDAGFQEGQPYLGSPARVDGRTRGVNDLRGSGLPLR